MLARLPESPALFPADQLCDVPERFLAAELIREHQAARATADNQDLGGLRKHPEILERLPKGLADPGELWRSLGDRAIPRAIPTIDRTHDRLETARSPLCAARRNNVTGA